MVLLLTGVSQASVVGAAGRGKVDARSGDVYLVDNPVVGEKSDF
jgi:hypothetical protein